jgi:hypothetical protein
MAHFANLDFNNQVTGVIVIDDEHENNGQEFINNVLKLEGIWVQTSYNTYAGVHLLGGEPLRKNYAGIGFLYDPIRDAFIPPKPEIGEWTLHEASCTWITSKPFPSWIFNEEKISWEAPTPYPTDDSTYVWNEEIVNWQEVSE